MYSNPYYGGGYYNSGYGYNNSMYDNSYYELAYDPDQSMMVLGVAAGYGKRLSWPDDYFQFMVTLNYQMYIQKNWAYLSAYFQNGKSHNVNLEFLLQRSSIDNPLYTRRGSQFAFSVSATPPYSLWDGNDYAAMNLDDERRYKLIEYHKWKFKAKIFSPLAPLTVKRTPVLMSRVEYGFVGHYNKNKTTPFETFYMGGDGMSGYSSSYGMETIGLRGYENGSIIGNDGRGYGYAYSRMSMEFRYPFLLEPSSTIYGMLFAEAGNAWPDLKSFNPFALKRSAGVGVRIFLPMIGLMGIDWAYGFDKPDGTGQRGGSNFHFIIGQEF
jgi:outer membrane protein insertion porin family